MKVTHHIEKDNKKRNLFKKYEFKRKVLKSIVYNRDIPTNKRFLAQLSLTKLPKNSSLSKINTRCVITGRSKAIYKKFKVSRIQIKKLVDNRQIMGLHKISW